MTNKDLLVFGDKYAVSEQEFDELVLFADSAANDLLDNKAVIDALSTSLPNELAKRPVKIALILCIIADLIVIQFNPRRRLLDAIEHGTEPTNFLLLTVSVAMIDAGVYKAYFENF